MEHRFLANTGLRVSALAFGTMPFGDSVDEATARALFHRCRDAGINLFDCADVYAKGEAERILGRLITDCREQLVITSKAYFPTSDDANARGGSRYHLTNAVNTSLRRLGTDRIDLFFLHRFDPKTALDETWRALDDLVRAGKILYLGVSNFSAWQTMKAIGVAQCHGYRPLCCIQPMYNLVKRQAEVELLPMALAENLGVFPYSPLGGGLLAGRYGENRRPEDGRLVTNSMYATRYGEAANYTVAERFTQLAREWGLHPAAMAIAWVAGHPAVTAPLIGARNKRQLDDCLSALTVTLSDEQRARISQLTPAPPLATDRNEETSAHNYGSR